MHRHAFPSPPCPLADIETGFHFSAVWLGYTESLQKPCPADQVHILHSLLQLCTIFPCFKNIFISAFTGATFSPFGSFAYLKLAPVYHTFCWCCKATMKGWIFPTRTGKACEHGAGDAMGQGGNGQIRAGRRKVRQWQSLPNSNPLHRHDSPPQVNVELEPEVLLVQIQVDPQ